MTEKKTLPVETPGEWVKFATENLQVAKREIKHETPACHTICFLCRESAEKFLKAYLISKGWELKKTHDIVELLGYCSNYDKEFILLVEEGSILNDYIADGRYPGDISFEDICLKQANEAIEKAEMIREFILHKLTGKDLGANKVSKESLKSWHVESR